MYSRNLTVAESISRSLILFFVAPRADTIAYVRRYELVVRSAPTHVYSAIAVTRRFLLGREMGDVGRATTLVHECAHTVLDAEARGSLPIQSSQRSQRSQSRERSLFV